MNEKDIVTIVWGDSIAYGMCDNEFGGWVNRLKYRLEENYQNHFVFNLGIPGNDSFCILERFESELLHRYNSVDEFRFIFSIGINDVKHFSYDDQAFDNLISNINKIIDVSHKYTKNIYFTDLLFPNPIIRDIFDIEDIKTVNKELDLICKDKGIKLIKISEVLKEDDLYDGLHPNSIGHDKIFKKIIKEIGD